MDSGNPHVSLQFIKWIFSVLRSWVPFASQRLSTALLFAPIIVWIACYFGMRIFFAKCENVGLVKSVAWILIIISVLLIVLHFYIDKKVGKMHSVLPTFYMCWAIFLPCGGIVFWQASVYKDRIDEHVLQWSYSIGFEEKINIFSDRLEKIKLYANSNPIRFFTEPEKLSAEKRCDDLRQFSFVKKNSLGTFSNNKFIPPVFIKKDEEYKNNENQIDVFGSAPCHKESKFATFLLMPDPTSVDRKTYEVPGENGSKLFFDFLVISKDFNWTLGSVCDLEQSAPEEGDEPEVAKKEKSKIESISVYEATAEIRNVNFLSGYDSVISIGTASHELIDDKKMTNEEKEEEEIRRAGERSEKLAFALSDGVKKTGKIYTLNLGYYRNNSVNSNGNSGKERPAVIIGFRYRGEKSIKVDAALLNRKLSELRVSKKDDQYLNELLGSYDAKNSQSIEKYNGRNPSCGKR